MVAEWDVTWNFRGYQWDVKTLTNNCNNGRLVFPHVSPIKGETFRDCWKSNLSASVSGSIFDLKCHMNRLDLYHFLPPKKHWLSARVPQGHHGPSHPYIDNLPPWFHLILSPRSIISNPIIPRKLLSSDFFQVLTGFEGQQKLEVSSTEDLWFPAKSLHQKIWQGETYPSINFFTDIYIYIYMYII